MRTILLIAAGLALLLIIVAAIGAALPRDHTASRTLRVRRAPQDVWPVVKRVTAASSVPVDVLEEDPPRRLVTRVKETEKMFGGTWTVAIAPMPDGSELTITENGWVANPVFRFVSRFIIGHHATMDDVLKQVAAALDQPAALTGR